MYQIFIAKPIDSLIFLPFGPLEAFRSQKFDPRGMTEKYQIVIARPIDLLIFQTLEFPEAFRSQKSDPRGMPEM